MDRQLAALPDRITEPQMNRLLLIFVAVVAVIVIGGGGFLMLWNPPAPTARVEKVLPDARFPR
jgi:hypothetical protein